jgi:hypothetical protein
VDREEVKLSDTKTQEREAEKRTKKPKRQRRLIRATIGRGRRGRI